MTTQGFPYRGFATGWYQVAWSHELRTGDVKPLRYFGEQLVLWRDESGSAHVFDAFCPHLGAHLGHGGKVIGGELQCPFHGWRWGSDGVNTLIPDGDRSQMRKAVACWPVAEHDSFIFVWYDPAKAGPKWEAPRVPEGSSGEYYDPEQNGVRCYAGIHANPMMIAENGVDVAHQKYVHGSAEVSEVVDISEDGPVFRTRHRILFGKDKASTWLTPNGEQDGHMDVEAYGVSIGIARFTLDKAVHVAATTPIDEETSDMRLTEFVQRENGAEKPSERALKRLEYMWRQAENDLRIWENMRYETRASFTPDELGPYVAFRRWAAQFFTAGEASPSVGNGETKHRTSALRA